MNEIRCTKKIVLASNSPRRKELLAGLGLDFEIRVLEGIDESYPETLSAQEIPVYISRSKADAYTPAADELIITADTIVWLDGHVYGKPHDEAEARAMLVTLQDRVHQVITGVTLKSDSMVHSFSCITEVHFSRLSEKEIDYYVSHYRPMDKAGAYGIQEWIGYIGVTALNGSYFNVMGLPVQRLYTELKSLGLIFLGE